MLKLRAVALADLGNRKICECHGLAEVQAMYIASNLCESHDLKESCLMFGRSILT